MRDNAELIGLLSITETTLREYLRDAKRDEKEDQKAKAWDHWLNCLSEREIAQATGIAQQTVNGWLSDRKANELEND
jgi:hypothetical protein